MVMLVRAVRLWLAHVKRRVNGAPRCNKLALKIKDGLLPSASFLQALILRVGEGTLHICSPTCQHVPFIHRIRATRMAYSYCTSTGQRAEGRGVPWQCQVSAPLAPLKTLHAPSSEPRVEASLSSESSDPVWSRGGTTATAILSRCMFSDVDRESYGLSHRSYGAVVQV